MNNPTNSFTKNLGSTLEKIPFWTAAASTALYVAGFLVVTSHLSTRGVFDQPLLSTKYILAGGLISIVAAVYYYFVLRRMHYRITAKPTQQTTTSEGWQVFQAIYLTVEIAYSCCFSALLLLILLGYPEVLYIQLIIATAFGLDKALNSFSAHSKFNKSAQVFILVLYTAVTLFCFFVAPLHNPLLPLILAFIGLSIMFFTVLSSRSWNNKEDLGFCYFYIALYVLSGIITFGVTTYGRISPKYGGAAPIKVVIQPSGEVGKEVQSTIEEYKDKTYLVLETQDNLFFHLDPEGEKEKYYSVNRDMINGLIRQPTPNTHGPLDLSSSVRAALNSLGYKP